MTTFWHKIMPKVPFITGWNVINFDWLYLVNRAKRLGIDPMAKMIGKLFGKTSMPTHIGLVDYMEVVQQIKPFKVMENFKLDYVANLALGVTKLKTNYATMMDAQKDAFNFVKYNIIDTVLVKFMEDKLKLLSVVFAISKVARIEVSKIFSNVFIAETLMCREFLKRGKHLNNDKRPLRDKSTYEGAFVMPPIPGYYKYILLYDFASMYPNTQIQFNISPDSFIGKGPAEGPHEIYTKNNTRFTNRFDSVSRTILADMYDERKRLKKVIKTMKETIKERQKDAAKMAA
jgi:DNA polymerase elongation subunit (family B)